MDDAQRDAALREVKRLRKMAADLAGQAEGLEELLAAEPEAAAAVDYAIGQSSPLSAAVVGYAIGQSPAEGVAAVDYAGGQSPAEGAAAVDYAVGQSPLPEGAAAGRQGGKEAVDWGSLAGRDLTDAVALGRKAEELLAEIVRVYSGFDRVRAIAVGQLAWEARVYVLTEATEFYDGELMGSLIDAEYDLHRRFEPLRLSVDYAAVGCPEGSETGYCGASLIWRRGDGDGE